MSTAKELFAAWRRKHILRFPFFIRSQPRRRERKSRANEEE